MRRPMLVMAMMVALVVSVLGTAVAQEDGGAAPTVTLTVASAPNVFGSPSYGAWTENVIAGIEEGEGPAAFFPATALHPEEFIVSPFPSWKGLADPADTVGEDFANERGNRVHMVTRVVAAPGEKVDVADGVRVGFPPNDYRAGGSGAVVFSYANLRVFGVVYDNGVDKSDGYDVLTSGSGPVDEIVAVVPAIGTEPAGDNVVGDGKTEQDVLDEINESLTELGTVRFDGIAQYGAVIDGEDIVGWDVETSHVFFMGEPAPQSRDECRRGGWVDFGVFANQGQCISSLQANANARR